MNIEQQIEIAETIKDQLGGSTFCIMTGSKNFIALESGLSFKVGRNPRGINRISIYYDLASDHYNMEFGRVRGVNYKVISKAGAIYCDQLRDAFTSHTELYTSL